MRPNEVYGGDSTSCGEKCEETTLGSIRNARVEFAALRSIADDIDRVMFLLMQETHYFLLNSFPLEFGFLTDSKTSVFGE